MHDVRIGTGRFFDRGIEAIVGTPEGLDELLLPNTDGLAPAEIPRTTALDELLSARNLDSLLQAYIHPELADRELLIPARFRSAMESVRTQLLAVVEDRRHANPQLAAKLDSAIQVLDNEIDLRGLLQMYLFALVQG